MRHFDLVSIDPGKRHCYLAGFSEGQLTAILEWSVGSEMPWTAAEIVGEKPVSYPGSPVRANDLIDLARALGECTGAIRGARRIELVTPADWKRQLPKALCHYRLWRLLSLAEQALFPATTWEKIQKGVRGGPYSTRIHNFLDAVGIGMFHLGRKVI